jgi:hypothetical protein
MVKGGPEEKERGGTFKNTRYFPNGNETPKLLFESNFRD